MKRITVTIAASLGIFLAVGCRGGAEEPAEPVNVVTATSAEEAQPTGDNDKFRRYTSPN